jgi:adenosylhomocysteine nucleosidase
VSEERAIGLVAVEQEAGALLSALNLSQAESVGWVRVHAGRWEDRDVVLAQTLVGQVAAAVAAQALMLRHRIGCLIACGSAGALAMGLDVGDVVIARRVVPHDAGSFVGDRFVPLGSMVRDRRGRPAYCHAFEADARLVRLAHEAASSLVGPPRVRVGTLASGNQGIFAPARRDWLHTTFGALAVDMESAAVAAVAQACGVPWVAVRSVSDQASLARWFDMRPLVRYVDDPRPAWRQAAARWGFLLRHPIIWREGRRLRDGLRLAAERAARVVASMVPRL